MRRHATGRSVLLVIFSLVSSVLLTHCGPAEVEGGPEETIRTFYRHLNDEAYGKAKSMYDDAVREILDDPDASSDTGFRNWVQQETKNGNVTKLEISKSSLSGDEATLEYAVLYADGTRERRNVTLTRHDEHWKLGFINKAE